MVNHKHSTIVLILFMVLLAGVIVTAVFTSDDVDELCSTSETVLYRNGTTWDCMTVAYAEMWGEEIGDVSMASANVYYNITNLSSTRLNGFTFNNGVLTAQATGLYQVTSQYSFSGTPNQEYHLKFHVDGTGVNSCYAKRVIGSGGDVGSASITCLCPVTAGDKITIAIENIDSAGDPTIHAINLNLVRVNR